MADVKLRDSGIMGRIVSSTSQDFQDLLRRFSAVAERRASHVVLPTSAQDVSLVIKFATRSVRVLSDIISLSFYDLRSENLSIAVKGGGNHAQRRQQCRGWLVIDLSNLNGISVDANKDQVTVGGGCRWGDVYSILHKHGMICVGGGVHVVGVGGHLTGGQ